MKTLQSLQEKYQGVPVICTGGVEASGVLTLNRSETLVVLSSKEYLAFRGDENGWFDLQLRSSDGTSILLHDALQTRSGSYGFDSAHEVQLFPNLVAFGHAPKLDQLRSISFTLKGLRCFFHYQHIEGRFIARRNQETKELLRLVRDRDSAELGEDAYDFSRPQDLYIVHSVPRAFKFRLEDRCYEIGITGLTRGLGWNNIEVRREPVATITFDVPTKLDEALKRVWEWRQFFVQLAMEPMAIEAIWGRVGHSYRSTEVQLYLPTLRDVAPQPSLYRLHPSTVPYNRWSERSKLAAVMKNWLAKGQARNTFRNALDGVIANMAEHNDVQDVVRLCGALESLDELSEASAITKDDLRLMANAAAEAMHGAGRQADPERLRNVLSALRRPSLSRRFGLLSACIEPAGLGQAIAVVAKEASRLRNLAAHGQPLLDLHIRTVPEVVEALASMCAMFDLMTSGVPTQANERCSISAVSRANHAVGSLMQMLPSVGAGKVVG